MHHFNSFRGPRFASMLLITLLCVSNVGLAQTLKPKSTQATVIDFKDMSLKMVVKNLASQLKLNVVFDDSFRDQPKYDLELSDVTLEVALKIVLLQTKSIAKVIEDKTIILLADNPTSKERFSDYATWSPKYEQKR